MASLGYGMTVSRPWTRHMQKCCYRQIDPNLNNYHSDLTGIGRTLWILDITDLWPRQGETQSKYANHHLNLGCDISCIMPHCVGVESTLSLVVDVITWWQSKSTGETVREKVVG